MQMIMVLVIFVIQILILMVMVSDNKNDNSLFHYNPKQEDGANNELIQQINFQLVRY